MFFLRKTSLKLFSEKYALDGTNSYKVEKNRAFFSFGFENTTGSWYK